MDLLTNAVESIQAGVEDYQNGTRRRLLSAVRNIHAGILLLYKEALVRLSPDNSNEALIKSKIVPIVNSNGVIEYIGKGKKTVDVIQIKERFTALNIITDWEKTKLITDVRNDIEHYYPQVTKEAMRGVVASAFDVIKGFAANELQEDPRTLLGQDVWDVMLQITDIYERERQECETALEAIAWNSIVLEEGVHLLNCKKCGSDLLKPISGVSNADAILSCRACGSEFDPVSYIPDAVTARFAEDLYYIVKDGGEYPYGECPSCGVETYILLEDRCAFCGDTAVTECESCGCKIPISEMASSPLCGYCHHMLSKHD
jgi:hypothetical protein